MRALVPVAMTAAVLAVGRLQAQEVHPDELVLKPQVDEAIAAGVERLLDQQLRDGSFGVHGNHLGGQTALCAYALLKCGVPLDHPALLRAFAFLDNVEPINTYAIGCMMLAYHVTGEAGHNERLEELLERMLDRQHKHGTWAYPSGAPDLSNTQYAALGLWAANKAGCKIPPEVWEELARGTMAHQEAFRMADVGESGRTGAAQREIAGFQYHAKGSKENTNATGTMTTAGVSILRICEIGLGKRLRGSERKELTRSLEAGMNWLDVNFSVTRDQKPDGRAGRWLLYYLYGIERVGGLMRREQFGQHWWYVEAARELLKRRKKKEGGWGAVHDTCFALLVLRRATMSGPMTGEGAGSGKSTHLFASGRAGDEIQLRGAGQQPLVLYIEKFGQRVLSKHKKYGLRILRVEYLEGERVLGQLAADPTKAWTELDTFVHRCPALPYGVHSIHARVVAVAPECPPGEVAETVTFGSKPMEVRIRDVFEPWMQELAEMQRDNELKGMKVTVTVSSREKEAPRVVDGMTHTHWLCDPEDESPTVTLEFEEPVRVRRLVLTQPLQKREDLRRMGLIRRLEVQWNDSKSTEFIELHPNPLAATEYELKRTKRVRKLTLQVVDRGGKPGLPVGFSEIVVERRK